MKANMHGKFFILLPVMSAALIFLIFARPEITGFAVAPAGIVNADIKVTTADGVVIPVDSVVEARIGDEVSSMPVSVFISKSGEPYELSEGHVPEIYYTGPGYTGNHTYIVPISVFNLTRKLNRGVNMLNVKIIYNGLVVSETETEVII